MKKIIFLYLFFSVNFVYAQLTYVPDDNFEQALIDLGYDSGPLDDYVLTSNINQITYLHVPFKGITDFTGIEDFIDLQILNCWGNNLTILDISQNYDLIELKCQSNDIISLDVSNNPFLRYLDCQQNNLSDLDINNGANHLFTYFNSSSNPNLQCIIVDNSEWAEQNWSEYIHPNSNFVENQAQCDALLAQQTYVPDDNFEQALVDVGLDSGPLDDYVQTVNINHIGLLSIENCNISDLTGIEDFEWLWALYCSNNQLTNLDLSSNDRLKVLECQLNQLENLNISNNVLLENLYCNDNQLVELNIENNPVLGRLKCHNNQLSNLNLHNNIDLYNLHCYNNQLTELDISDNLVMRFLDCSSNLLTDLEVYDNTLLDTLICFSNGLTAIDISNNALLYYLNCSYNQLDAIDVSHNTELTHLYVIHNQISELDFSAIDSLFVLDCSNNLLTELDVSNQVDLDGLGCSNNQITDLYLHSHIYFSVILCNNNLLTEIDLDGLMFLAILDCSNNFLTELDLTSNINIAGFYCNSNPNLSSIDLRTNNSYDFQEFYALNNPVLSCVFINDIVLDEPEYSLWNVAPTVNFVETEAECDAIGIDEIEFNKSVEVFPNPTNNLLNIRLLNEIEMKDAVLYNNLGNAIIKTSNNFMNVSNLETGIYILRIVTKDDKIISKIIIIENE